MIIMRHHRQIKEKLCRKGSYEEPEAPRVSVRDDEERDLVDHDLAEPQRLVDPPKEVSHKRKLAWARELI